MQNKVDIAQVAGYLRFIAKNAHLAIQIEPEFHEKHGINETTYRLLRAGLRAAATQLENGILADQDFSMFKTDRD